MDGSTPCDLGSAVVFANLSAAAASPAAVCIYISYLQLSEQMMLLDIAVGVMSRHISYLQLSEQMMLLDFAVGVMSRLCSFSDTGNMACAIHRAVLGSASKAVLPVRLRNTQVTRKCA